MKLRTVGIEGAPDAWLEIEAWAADGLDGLAAGDELIVITWLHQADRETFRVHPRSDPRDPLTGVFASRPPQLACRREAERRTFPAL